MIGKVSTFASRLNEALHTRCVKAAELARETGISKSLISQYRNSYCEAKQDNLYIIANYLKVDYGWLMGFDVPMELESEEHLKLRETIRDKILYLPTETLNKILQYIEDIT